SRRGARASPPRPRLSHALSLHFQHGAVLRAFGLAAHRARPLSGSRGHHHVAISYHSPTPMKIEGIKGCFEKTHGLFYFARMCSKIRLHAQGKLPEDYYEMLGQGFDGRTCRYLWVRYEDVKAHVLAGESEADVLE